MKVQTSYPPLKSKKRNTSIKSIYGKISIPKIYKGLGVGRTNVYLPKSMGSEVERVDIKGNSFQPSKEQCISRYLRNMALPDP